jgi:hypothetical protein
MSPTCPTVALGVGDWRDPFIGPLAPRPARLAGIIAILRCLISALITLSPLGGSVPAARSAKLGVITESEKGTYHRIRLNLQPLPKLEAP